MSRALAPRSLASASALGLLMATSLFALAQPSSPGRGPRRPVSLCEESVPQGSVRPSMTEVFPDKGIAGYAATLEVTLEHGKGEAVMPEGFKRDALVGASRTLADLGFVVPEPDGGVGPSVETEEKGDHARSVVRIPFVPLPKQPGRNQLVLPALPITLQRSSGAVVTLCTRPHVIVVEDPTSSTNDPKVKGQPEPRSQREEWTLLKNVLAGLALGALLTALTVLVARRWLRRDKPDDYVPQKLPWVVALEELEALETSPLLDPSGPADDAAARARDHIDRVSDALRKYLGSRYGFDGLEATSDEVRAHLRRVRPFVPAQKAIAQFLEECDLVKFASVTPVREDCVAQLARAVGIVRATIPPADLATLDEAKKQAKLIDEMVAKRERRLRKQKRSAGERGAREGERRRAEPRSGGPRA